MQYCQAISMEHRNRKASKMAIRNSLICSGKYCSLVFFSDLQAILDLVNKFSIVYLYA